MKPRESNMKYAVYVTHNYKMRLTTFNKLIYSLLKRDKDQLRFPISKGNKPYLIEPKENEE